MNSLQKLNEEIVNWDTVISGGFRRYDLAFFKIFIKFEVFISDLFLLYALGKKSPEGFKPKRKLCFKTEEQIRKIFSYGKQYVDIINLLNNHCIYNEIFIESSDPFNLIFNSIFSDDFRKMCLLRNYIAHESVESKFKYQKSLLEANSINIFIEPNEFLSRRKNRRDPLTFYSSWTSLLKDKSSVLINPEPYLR